MFGEHILTYKSVPIVLCQHNLSEADLAVADTAD